MSVDMLNRAFKIKGLSPTKKFILVLLGNYADENGQCYPSHRHIADIIGLKDTKGIQRSIKEFEELGYLTIEHRKKADGGFTSNRYTMTLPTGSNTPTGEKPVSVRASAPTNTKKDTKTYSIEFLNWYQLYPRRVGKHQAWLKYQQAQKDVSVEELWEATNLFRQECIAKDTPTEYIAHPSTWLNQKRFIDYLEMNNNEKLKLTKVKQGSLNNIAG